jgi:hypothetical protein
MSAAAPNDAARHGRQVRRQRPGVASLRRLSLATLQSRWLLRLMLAAARQVGGGRSHSDSCTASAVSPISQRTLGRTKSTWMHARVACLPEGVLHLQALHFPSGLSSFPRTERIVYCNRAATGLSEKEDGRR